MRERGGKEGFKLTLTTQMRILILVLFSWEEWGNYFICGYYRGVVVYGCHLGVQAPK